MKLTGGKYGGKLIIYIDAIPHLIIPNLSLISGIDSYYEQKTEEQISMYYININFFNGNPIKLIYDSIEKWNNILNYIIEILDRQ